MSSGEASLAKPFHAGRDARQVDVQQEVGGIVDQQVVLVGLHPFFLVVLKARVFRHTVAGPAEYLDVEHLESPARDGSEDRAP